jgi:hypothetical protein
VLPSSDLYSPPLLTAGSRIGLQGLFQFDIVAETFISHPATLLQVYLVTARRCGLMVALHCPAVGRGDVAMAVHDAGTPHQESSQMPRAVRTSNPDG